MPAYHVSGLSGAGKSEVGIVLEQRGFRVIETDFENGLSNWYNIDTGEEVIEMPELPYPEEWVSTHRWMWNESRMNELLKSVGNEVVFFCGSAYNEHEFKDLFDKRFGLYANSDILVARLQQRDPKRWADGAAELKFIIYWSEYFKQQCKTTEIIVIDSTQPSEAIADTILSYLEPIDAMI